MTLNSIRQLLACGFIFVSVNAFASDNNVTISLQPEYMDASVIADFEAQTGIKVKLTPNSESDVMVVSLHDLALGINEGRFEKLDKSKIPNIGGVWPEISKFAAATDPTGDFSVNYLWYTIGIGYNQKAIDAVGEENLNSLDVVFNNTISNKISKACNIAIIDDSDVISYLANIYNNLDLNSYDLESIQKTWGNSAKGLKISEDYTQYIRSEDACVVIGWSNQIQMASKQLGDAGRQEIKFNVPKEGSVVYLDQLAVAANARNKDGAYALINYLLDPTVAARITNQTGFANGVKGSLKLIDESILKHSGSYPMSALSSLSALPNVDSKQHRLHTRVWTNIQTDNR